jgi:hypothetical protein
VTERASLFRREALEFHAAQPRHGGVLRIDPPWARWFYWIVLALVAAGVLTSAVARTSETTSGPALINVRQGSFVALVPATSPDLRRGRLVRLQLDGRPLAARVLRAQFADRAGVRRAGFASSAPGVLVTGLLERQADVAASPSSPRAEGRAVVVLRSKTILDLFLGELRGMLGTGKDS